MNNAKTISRVTILTLTGALLLSSACSQTDEEIPVYEATAQRLYDGSVVYAEAGCVGCHGPKFDGKGPDASRLARVSKLTVPNLIAQSNPQKTVVGYFKTITAGNATLKAGGESHSYQQYTDRGRWAMANFLYSLAPAKFRNNKKHKKASTKAMKEAKAAYAKAAESNARRWNIGFTQSKEPSKTELEAIINKADVK